MNTYTVLIVVTDDEERERSGHCIRFQADGPARDIAEDIGRYVYERFVERPA